MLEYTSMHFPSRKLKKKIQEFWHWGSSNDFIANIAYVILLLLLLNNLL